jgi:hypothetical protein
MDAATVRTTEDAMIPKLLLAAVATLLAAEGYSLMTAPASLVRAAVNRLHAGRD